MKNNKGFTLIELLAIIVILAIIAVITVPIILNIIENAKMGAATDSAYGYKDSINKWYLTKLSEDSDYNIPDNGYKTSDLKNMGLSISGKQPGENSWVIIKNNAIKDGCLQFDEFKVEIKDEKIDNTSKGECEEYIEFNGTYIAPSQTDTHKGVVYLDPNNLSTECSSTVGYSETQSVPGVKTGCMKFYIFDENDDGTVDMILDHNTSTQICWNRDAIMNNNFKNTDGPKAALYQLYEDTNDWNGIKYLDEKDNYTSGIMVIDYTKHLSRAEIQSANYSPYTYTPVEGPHRARFITSEEVAAITNPNNWTTYDDFYYFGSLSQTSYGSQNEDEQARQRSYGWLFERLYNCENSGCSSNDDTVSSGNSGYWTASRQPQYNRGLYAGTVQGNGNLFWSNVSSSYYGIRPVITLSKNILGI